MPDDRELTLHVEQTPTHRILRLVGEMTAYAAGEIREALADARKATDRLVVDLSEVPFMDSAGMGALIGGMRSMRDVNGDVAVVVVVQNFALRRLLKTTRFDRIVRVFGSVEAALSTDDWEPGEVISDNTQPLPRPNNSKTGADALPVGAVMIESINAAENLQRHLHLLLSEKRELQQQLEQAFALIDKQSVAVQRAETTLKSLEAMCAYLGERLLAAQVAPDSNDTLVREAIVVELRQASTTTRALLGSLGAAATFFFGGMQVQAALAEPDSVHDQVGALIINVYEAVDACEQVGI